MWGLLTNPLTTVMGSTHEEWVQIYGLFFMVHRFYFSDYYKVVRRTWARNY